jgi:membrane protein implicated in regulation of membrane protease activity
VNPAMSVAFAVFVAAIVALVVLARRSAQQARRERDEELLREEIDRLEQ